MDIREDNELRHDYMDMLDECVDKISESYRGCLSGESALHCQRECANGCSRPEYKNGCINCFVSRKLDGKAPYKPEGYAVPVIKAVAKILQWMQDNNIPVDEIYNIERTYRMAKKKKGKGGKVGCNGNVD